MVFAFRGMAAGKTALLGSSVLTALAVSPAWAQQTAPATLPPVQVEGRAPAIEADQVLTQQQIDNDQPMTLRQLFRGEPSITVPSGSTAAQKLYLHGIDQNKLNVTIDGTPQRNNVWHHNGNMSLDPLFLKAVEVESGVSAADSGPGALGGSVRFKTKDARDMLLPGQTVGGTGIFGYDTNSGTWRSTGAGYMALDGYELLGIGTLARGDNYENGRGMEEPGTATHLNSGLVKLGYEALGGHRLKVSTEYVEDDAIRRMRPNMGAVVGGGGTGGFLNSNRATRSTSVLSYETAEPTEFFDPKAELYYNRNRLQRPNDNNITANASGTFNTDVVSIGGKLQNSFAIRGGSLTAGVDYYHDDIEIDRIQLSPDVGETVQNFGAFAQARVSLQDDWRVSTGLRVDAQEYNSVDNQTFKNTGASPNLTTEYDFTSRVTGFAGYGYTFGGIEMAEAAQFHSANFTYDPGLDPSRAHNYKAGLRYRHEGLLLEGTVFRTEIMNPTAFNYTTNRRINGDDLKTRGFDLLAGYRWENAAVSAKYTHTDVKYGGRMALPSDYSTAVPVGDLLVLSGEYTLQPYRLTLGGSSEMARGIDDKALISNSFRPIDGYAIFNAFTQWVPIASMPHWTVRLEANNIFDAAYVARSSYTTSSSPNVTQVLSEGRSFYLSTTVKF